MYQELPKSEYFYEISRVTLQELIKTPITNHIRSLWEGHIIIFYQNNITGVDTVVPIS